MRYLLFLISFLLLSPAWAGAGLDVQGWARATATKARNGVVYITIKNFSDAGDRLFSAKSLVAKSAALHNHVMDSGVMKMRPVGSLKIPAYGTVIMKPGGLHVMLMGLKSPLVKGGSLLLTLTFEKAGDLTVQIKIMGMGAKGVGETYKMRGKKEHKH